MVRMTPMCTKKQGRRPIHIKKKNEADTVEKSKDERDHMALFIQQNLLYLGVVLAAWETLINPTVMTHVLELKFT